ncbi:MAG: hypothetical protein ABL897_01005 [Hyphomicrobium sp.]
MTASWSRQLINRRRSTSEVSKAMLRDKPISRAAKNRLAPRFKTLGKSGWKQLDVAARAQILSEQAVVIVCVSPLRRIQLAAIAGFFDQRWNAARIELVQLATNCLARLAERERFCTRISASACATAALKTRCQNNDADDTGQNPHAHSYPSDDFVVPAGYSPQNNMRFMNTRRFASQPPVAEVWH